MNAEISLAGVLRTREAGGFLIDNVRIDHQRTAAIGFNYPDAGLALEMTQTQQFVARECLFRSVPS
ncbi:MULTISPECIES: hypothetical protein [unclassified Mesorhizobium]|uniref:hypothetical protein n=1 Tax=unclassified Mesorhizobium TaxID=325217 RepID=UPI00112B4841|nr:MULTISPECIES: hypothetical protein [unclassified Mesorhizobium]TPJ57036.1 hypothetical protein FJ443_30305 [Mesorhizobium sp. B2-6-1]TPM19800.1 hypothetical protein FJ953_15480 [Mesorhizobium sp. B2-3-6]TPN34767.1 hypothetical protein FJ979_21515 [Mesorhizobium sp. B1-1-6]